MTILYVAKSQSLCKWGASVGVTKYLYKVGVTEDTAEAAVKALNDTRHGGETDWKLIKKQEAEGIDEAAAIGRLAARERMIDPAFYPKIKGARGIFKVKIPNVEDQMLVSRAMEGAPTQQVKITPAEIAAYLLRNAVA
ncbi:MAG: hypothetical protein WCF16_01660 [Alphaproteobacteria bacterium]